VVVEKGRCGLGEGVNSSFREISLRLLGGRFCKTVTTTMTEVLDRGMNYKCTDIFVLICVAFRPDHPASFDQNHADDQEVLSPLSPTRALPNPSIVDYGR